MGSKILPGSTSADLPSLRSFMGQPSPPPTAHWCPSGVNGAVLAAQAWQGMDKERGGEQTETGSILQLLGELDLYLDTDKYIKQIWLRLSRRTSWDQSWHSKTPPSFFLHFSPLFLSEFFLLLFSRFLGGSDNSTQNFGHPRWKTTEKLFVKVGHFRIWMSTTLALCNVPHCG